MKRFLLFFALLAAPLGVRAQNGAVGAIPGISAENYPRLDGSTSTMPLGWLLGARAWGYNADLRRGSNWRWEPQGAVFPSFPVETSPETVREYLGKIAGQNHEGTGKAYLNLIADKRDLILVARPPSQSEIAAAKKAGVTLEMRPIARDALVFLVNAQNPVKNLSRAQLRAIFTGKTRLWRAVGGRDFPILALTRNENSGSQELLDTLLLPAEKAAVGEPNTRLDSMEHVIDRVAQNPNALGYSVFYYERFMAPRPQNRVLSVDGVLPSAQSLADGSYPFVAPVFAVVRAGLPADSPTLTLRDWLLSSEGQKLVAQSGNVPAP